MSDRVDFYFRQRVSEAELDQPFAYLENADRNWCLDGGNLGVLYGLGVAQAGVPGLSVAVAGPGAAYDQQGQRVFVAANQSVDVSKDSSNVSTAVSAPGKEKKVSVYIKFARSLSDPRVDGNSITVYFQRLETFQFVVLQGAEANVGTATPPALLADGILLADITLIFGQTTVLNASIATTSRRQDNYAITGSPQSIRRGRVGDALSDLLSLYNTFVAGTGDTLAATRVNYAGGVAWADGTTNPAASVEAQLDKILTELAATAGALKIGGTGGVGRIQGANAWTGANTFSDITTTGTNRYKLTSRSLVRVSRITGNPVDSTQWALDTGGGTYQWVTSSIALTGPEFIIPVDIPNGCTLTRIDVYIKPPAGHSAFPGGVPGSMPQAILKSVNLLTGALTANLGVFADNSASAGVYEAYHALSITGLSVAAATEASRYFVRFHAEGSTNAIAGTILYGAVFTFTTTAQDDGG